MDVFSIFPTKNTQFYGYSNNYYMRLSKHLSISTLGIFFGLTTFLLNLWAHRHPAFVEHWYSRGLFQAIRGCFDYTLGLLPFPSFYLFWIALIVSAVLFYRNRPKQGSLLSKLGNRLFRLLGFSGLLFGLFFWLWGFNYARIPLEKQMGLQVQALDSTTLWQAFETETQCLDSLRTMLVGNNTSALDDKRFWPVHAEDTIREALTKWLAQEGFPVTGRVRGRIIYPAGTLFGFGAAGIYWPFVGEGNIEAGLHPLRKLPAMAHEMSHGYGFSDEGVCNFTAYAALCEHPNTYIAYCSRLDYWNTLAKACRQNNPRQFENQLQAHIPKGIIADELAIERQNSKFGELAPAIRYEVYDNYLKAQGVSAGMMSYEEVLMLVAAWRRR